MKRGIVPLIVGDCVMLPSARPTNNSLDRKRVTPGASRLMAMPATMWSTPKVTVAKARRSPPSAPPTAPAPIAAHGPQCQPAQPALHVPRIIIPSSPMLTTPTRSENSPPRAANTIGDIAAMAAMNVLPAVRSSAPDSRRTSDSSARPPNAIKSGRT